MQYNFDLIKEEFEKYASGFNLNNEKIKYKQLHPYRVVDYIKRIAEAEGLNEHDRYIAELIAMYHDIARFEQLSQFDTFYDVLSFDHGDRGSEIMQENNWIDKFVDNLEDRNIVIKAIKNHNKFKIEEGLSKRELYFAKMIRDADKIDIMNMQYKNPQEEKTKIFEEALIAFRENRQIKRSKDTVNYTYSTKLCMMLAYIFDFNFKETFRIVTQEKIIETRLKVLKETSKNTEVADEIIQIVNSYIERKLNE